MNSRDASQVGLTETRAADECLGVQNFDTCSCHPESSGLAWCQDMKVLQRRCGVDKVHLRLSFARRLHPFYPPFVEVSIERKPKLFEHIRTPHRIISPFAQFMHLIVIYLGRQ